MVTRERRRQLDLGEVPTPSTPRPDAGVRSVDEQELVDALLKMPIGADVGTKMLKKMGHQAKFSGREANPSIAWKKLLTNVQRILPQYHPCFKLLCSVNHTAVDTAEVQHDADANSRLFDVLWSLMDEPAQLVLDSPELQEGRDGHRALVVLNMRYTQQGCQEIAQLEHGISELYRTINRTSDPQESLREMSRLYRALCSANGSVWTEKGSLQKATMLLGAQYDWLKREFDRGLHQSTASFERVLMNDWLEFGNTLARDKSNTAIALASMTLERDTLMLASTVKAAAAKIRPPENAAPAPRRQKEDARRAEQDPGGRGRDPPRARPEKKERPRGEEKRKLTCFICKQEHRAEVCPYSDDVAKMVAKLPAKDAKPTDVAAAARHGHYVGDDYGYDGSDDEYGHISTAVRLLESPGPLWPQGTLADAFQAKIPKSYDAAMVDEHELQMRAEMEAQAESVVEKGSLHSEPDSALTARTGCVIF